MPEIGRSSWLLRAYTELTTERNINGVIPISAIWSYSDRYGLGELFVSQIQLIESNFLKKAQEDGGNKKANN